MFTGFAMLLKMGYTPGTVLGKTPTASALAEPIRVEVKETRAGLGHTQQKVEPNAKKPKASKSKKGAKNAIGKDMVGAHIFCVAATRARIAVESSARPNWSRAGISSTVSHNVPTIVSANDRRQ